MRARNKVSKGVGRVGAKGAGTDATFVHTYAGVKPIHGQRQTGTNHDGGKLSKGFNEYID